MPTGATEATDVRIVPYEPAHGEHVAADMRLSDRREIYYLATLRPLPAIRATVAMSDHATTALIDGEPVLIWGMARRTFLSDVGVPWLLGTPKADLHQYRFGRRSRDFFRDMASHYPIMENYALAENGRTLRWLKWLGFDMEEAKPYGAFRAPFVRFGRRLECA